jgi:hypothetical protein
MPAPVPMAIMTWRRYAATAPGCSSSAPNIECGFS